MRAALGSLVLVAMLPLVGSAPSAIAADNSAAITLQGQTPWVAPGGDLVLRLHVKGDPSGLEIAATVHRAVATRSQLADTVAGRRLGGVEGLVVQPVDGLPIDGDGNRVLTIGIQDPNAPRDPARVALPRDISAIYPVEIELRTAKNDATIDQFVTHLALLGSGGSPLSVAMVWRLDATPAHRADGSVGAPTRHNLDATGRVGRMVDALANAPDVPATVQAVPETLEAWLDTAPRPGDPESSPALTALRTMTGQPTRQFVSGPFVDVDLPSLEAAGLGDEAGAQFARGADDLRNALGFRPDPRTVVVGSVDAAALARLRSLGADRVAVDPSAVPLATRLTPANPFTITSRGRTFTASVLDPGLRDLLGHPSDAPALRAQRFLTGLMLVALEAPGESRGVVVDTPVGWDAPAALLEGILGGLRANPVLRPNTLDGWFAHVPARGSRSLPATTRGVSIDRVAIDREDSRVARHRLDGFDGLVGDSDPVAAAAERDLLLAERSVTKASERRAAHAYLDGVNATIDGVAARVHAPAGRTVTLTARRASIPISIINANPRPLAVRIRLVSDKLLFPHGSGRDLTLPPHATTMRFAVETRTSGAFPLTITITSPDGSLVVTSSQLTVRSTAVSGMGVFLAGGAGAFLFLWWGWHLRTRGRRRPRTLAPPVAAAVVANDPGAAEG